MRKTIPCTYCVDRKVNIWIKYMDVDVVEIKRINAVFFYNARVLRLKEDQFNMA